MNMASESIAQQALVGIPQIADIAGVGRSAVGNWRKRHDDFPAPRVQAPSGALFDLREVEDWLIVHGKIARRAPASARLWGLADAARGQWSISQFVNFVSACLVYIEACDRAHNIRPDTGNRVPPRIPRGADWSDVRRRDPQGFLPALCKAAHAIESRNLELEGLLGPSFREVTSAPPSTLAYHIAVTLDSAADDASTRYSLFEYLIDLASNDRHSGGEFSTPGDVAALVAQLLDFQGGTILDPAVGTGELLQQAALRQSDSEAEAAVLGIDINQNVWRLARSRFYLYGRPAEIRNENALIADLDSLPKADAVVADPPMSQGNWGYAELYVDPRWRFGSPPPNSADFAWLQLASLRLKPAGRAAVVTSTGSLFRSGREGDIRETMLEAGIVEAVIVLPPRLRLNTSIPLAVWLLRSPDARTTSERVLLVDASDLGVPGRSRFSLPEPSIGRIVDLVRQWRDKGDIALDNEDIAASVPLDDIFAAEANLSPTRYRSQPKVDFAEAEHTALALRQSLRESSAAAAEANAELLSYLEGRR
jgi:type I restriction enzyme M protein